MSSEGILFIATGATHRAEAAASARAGRAHAGGRPIAIMTDDVEAAEAMGCFDRCLPHPDPRHSYRDKIPGLLDLPFDRTLFLDSDARPTARLDGLFALLDHHDLAAAQAPVRIPAGWRDQAVPDEFPELNTGVLLLRRGQHQAELVDRWLERYDEIGQDWDQATFRSAAWALLPKGLRLATLPPEANLRTTKPWIAGKGIPVTVVHGRVPEAEWPALLDYLNGDIERFRTSTEWLERHRDSALTPRVSGTRPAGTPPIDLPRRSVRSGAVVMVAQAITVGLGIGSMAVLGRLLTPADFGVVSIATAFVAFVTMLPKQGLPQAIVQRDDLADAQLNSLFWLNVGGGVLAAVIGTLAAWPISAWFARPELFGIMTALAGALVATGVGAPHAAVLRRELRFRTHATVGVVANLIGVATGITTAWAGWSYWSLVAMTVTTTVTRAIGMWTCSGWRPSRPAIADGIRPMVRLGAYLGGTSLLTTASRSISRIMIGFGLGDAAAGYYTNASRLIVQPATQLNTPLTSVAIPALSRLQSDPERFRAFYRRGLEAVIFLLCPFMLVAMAGADHLIPLFLGPQWTASIPLFLALTPAGLVTCTGVATSWVYIPLGRTDRQFRWRILSSIVTIVAVLIGLRWGTLGVAVAFSVQAVAMRIPAIAYCLHGTFLRGTDVAGPVWRTALAAVPAVLGGGWCAEMLPIDTSHLAACAGIATTTFFIYLLAFACTPGGIARLRATAELTRHLRRPPTAG